MVCKSLKRLTGKAPSDSNLSSKVKECPRGHERPGRLCLSLCPEPGPSLLWVLRTGLSFLKEHLDSLGNWGSRMSVTQGGAARSTWWRSRSGKLGGSAWGVQINFPSWQRVETGIPGRASKVSKDMQGTHREMPTGGLWPGCSQMGIPQSRAVKTSDRPRMPMYHYHLPLVKETTAQCTLTQGSHLSIKDAKDALNLKTGSHRGSVIFAHSAADQWTWCPELVQVCIFGQDY